MKDFQQNRVKKTSVSQFHQTSRVNVFTKHVNFVEYCVSAYLNKPFNIFQRPVFFCHGSPLLYAYTFCEYKVAVFILFNECKYCYLFCKKFSALIYRVAVKSPPILIPEFQTFIGEPQFENNGP